MRLSDKEIIYVRLSSRLEIAEMIKELIKNDIQCKSMAYKSEVKTNNVTIKYLIIPAGEEQRNYVRGIHAVGCFGFDEDTAVYLTRGNNVCQDYTLSKYVKEINEMGY